MLVTLKFDRWGEQPSFGSGRHGLGSMPDLAQPISCRDSQTGENTREQENDGYNCRCVSFKTSEGGVYFSNAENAQLAWSLIWLLRARSHV